MQWSASSTYNNVTTGTCNLGTFNTFTPYVAGEQKRQGDDRYSIRPHRLLSPLYIYSSFELPVFR